MIARDIYQILKKMIIDNLDNHNTIDIKNYKYSQIHPGPIMAIHDLLRFVSFRKNKFFDQNNNDLGYSWIWYYKRGFFSDLNFKFRKRFLKLKLKKKNNFRNKYIDQSEF